MRKAALRRSPVAPVLHAVQPSASDLLFAALALGIWHPRQGNAIVGKSLRDPEAEAEIKPNDIDQMIEARNDLRRRAGKPSIGDDLASQLDDDLR